jgi:RecA/RadA recombinase
MENNMHAYRAAAVVQEDGEVVAIIDTTGTFDPQTARDCGCQIDTLLVSQPTSELETAQIIKMLLESGSVGLVVVI